MKKFINANIYGQYEASEILVENGVFKTYNGAKVMQLKDEYGIEQGKPANFIVLDVYDTYEAVRERSDVLASIRSGEYLFRRAPRKNEVSHALLEDI